MPITKRAQSKNSEDVAFDNSDTALSATNIRDAIIEIAQRFFQQSVEPSSAEGATVGDIWYDETEDKLKVYISD